MVKTPCKYHDTKFSRFSEKMALRSQNLTSHFFNGVLGLHLKNGDILRQLFLGWPTLLRFQSQTPTQMVKTACEYQPPKFSRFSEKMNLRSQNVTNGRTDGMTDQFFSLPALEQRGKFSQFSIFHIFFSKSSSLRRFLKKLLGFPELRPHHITKIPKAYHKRVGG